MRESHLKVICLFIFILIFFFFFSKRKHQSNEKENVQYFPNNIDRDIHIKFCEKKTKTNKKKKKKKEKLRNYVARHLSVFIPLFALMSIHYSVGFNSDSVRCSNYLKSLEFFLIQLPFGACSVYRNADMHHHGHGTLIVRL